MQQQAFLIYTPYVLLQIKHQLTYATDNIKFMTSMNSYMFWHHGTILREFFFFGTNEHKSTP